LLETKFSTDLDAILFADSLNKTALYYGIMGDLSNARFYNMLALNHLETCKGEAYYNPVFESVMWTRITYNLDLVTLESGYEWAKTRGLSYAMAYTLFLLIITMINPEINNLNAVAKIRYSIQEKHKNLLLCLFTQLTEVLERSKYRDVKDNRRTYAKLLDNGLGAIKSWILSDFTQATIHVESAAIQAALITTPSLEAFIPTYFATFVAMQMISFDKSKFADLAEILIQCISRINSMRWARPLTDFIVLALERYVGRIHVDWYNLDQ